MTDTRETLGAIEPRTAHLVVMAACARPRYSAEAVNAAIAQSNRAGRKISKAEARRIHALLKGRA